MTTLALSTGSLYTYGLARVFDLAAEAGFDAVEVLIDDRWDTRQPAYLRQLSRATGLPVAAAHNPFLPYVSGWPSDPVGRLRESARVAREIGAPVVVAHLPLRIRGAKVQLFGFRARPLLVPIPLPNEGDYRRFLLNGLARFEAEEGVIIAVENMPAKRILGRAVDIHALNHPDRLATLPHLTLDTTHLGTWGLDPVVIYEQLKARVAHVHLSNFNGQEHRLLEDGHLSLGKLLERLAQDGYGGAVTVELGPEVLHAEDEAQARDCLHQVVAFCRVHGGLEQGGAA
jgi:sugar phosphate isomerase/epimerase